MSHAEALAGLRIMVIGPPGPDFFADNVRCGIEDAGHSAVVTDPFHGVMAGSSRVLARAREAAYMAPELARRAHRHLIELAEETSPDLVLNLDFRLGYRIVGELRAAAKAPICFWFPDSPGNVRQETFLLARYDALFFADTRQVTIYRDVLGENAHILAQGCNPRWHRPTGNLLGPRDPPKVVVAGNMYAVRYLLLQRLLADGIELEIHGSEWPRWLPLESRTLRPSYSGSLVLKGEKARAFRSASAVLNSTVSHEGDYLNARLFEATACAALVVTHWHSRLPELFDVGNEVFAYRSYDELVAQIRRVASMDLQEREAIAGAASARAHHDHSYAARIAEILSEVGRG